MRAHYIIFAIVVASCSKGDKASSAEDSPKTPGEKLVETPAQSSKPSTQPASKPSGHVSGVRYVEQGCDGAKPCLCKGVLEFGQNGLKQIGITEADLTSGTACLFGDYDGNGVDDIAFLDKSFGKEGKKAQVQVLLFDDRGLRDIKLLPKKVLGLAVHKTPGKGAGLYDPKTEGGKKHMFVYVDGRFGLAPRP